MSGASAGQSASVTARVPARSWQPERARMRTAVAVTRPSMSSSSAPSQ